MKGEGKLESDCRPSRVAVSDPFLTLVNEFSARTVEVKNLFMSRVDGRVQEIYAAELSALENHVAALEEKMKEMQQFLQRESSEITKVRALQKACVVQKNELADIEKHLPARLPTLYPEQGSRAQELQQRSPRNQSPKLEASASAKVIPDIPPGEQSVRGKSKKKSIRARMYVTQSELSSVSSYMRGRLTIERINSAVDEIVRHAEANSKLIAAARTRGSTITSEERNHAMGVLHKIAKQGDVEGCSFFLESDLKGGTHATLDNTGKSILTILRHVGKIRELRVNVGDTTRIVYVLP